MNKISLSICIPTYNFGKFIGQTLDSIIPNLREGIEVIILDDGSTDNTDIEVEKRLTQNNQIKYHKQGFKGGIDKDIAKVISLSKGEYCWLFSADDLMLPGSVDKILNILPTGYDVFLCEQFLCDYNMNIIKRYSIFKNINRQEKFDLSDIKQRKRYFKEALNTEAFFSFLAGPIFKKTVWDNSEDIPESFYKTSWGLAGRLLSQVPKGLIVYYLNETLLLKRSGNDSFLNNGLIKRIQITIDGYSHIAATIFGNKSFEAFHIRRVMRNEWVFKTILYAKLQTKLNPEKEKLELLNKLAHRLYSSAGIINICKYAIFRFTPILLIEAIWLLKKKIKSK